MTGIVLVFDIGKTHLKLLEINSESGEEIHRHLAPNFSIQSGPYPHADVSRLENFLFDGIAAAAKRNGGLINGITVTTHGASGALLKGEELALPILDYEYEGPEELFRHYAHLRPDFSETLSPFLPGGLNLGAQVFWQSRVFSDKFNLSSTFVTYPQYWAFKLSGVLSIEMTSLGCHTDLWAPQRRSFSSLVYKAGWDKLMPPVRKAGDIIGTLKPTLSKRLGLNNCPKIYCGIQDSNASLLPYLNPAAEGILLSSGTWAIFFSLGSCSVKLNENRDMLANVNAFGEPVYSARFMGGREYERIINGNLVRDPTSEELMKVLKSRTMAIPNFAPGSGPFPNSKGRLISAITMPSSGELQAIASLYIALMSNVCINLLNTPGEIIINGPFADNELYCDALASLSGRTIVKNIGVTATSEGVVRLMLPHLPVQEGRRAKGLQHMEHFELMNYAREWHENVNN